MLRCFDEVLVRDEARDDVTDLSGKREAWTARHASTEISWESPTTVAPLWPTLTGSLLAEDEHRRCAPATVASPDVRLLVPTPYETSVSLAGLRVQGPFASRADSDFTGTCDVPVEAQCSSGQASPEGVCEPY